MGMAFVSRCFSFPFIYGFCFMPFFPSIHIWLLFHAVFTFPLYMAFISCCFSLLLYMGFVSFRFSLPFIYGFCFMPFFPFPLCLAFVSCRFSFPFTFLLIFSSYLNMQEICIWKQAVNQFFNQSVRQSSFNMTINQSNRQSISLSLHQSANQSVCLSINQFCN